MKWEQHSLVSELIWPPPFYSPPHRVSKILRLKPLYGGQSEAACRRLINPVSSCGTFLLGGSIDAVRTSNLEMVIQLLLKILYSGYICNGDKQKEWFCLQWGCCHSIGKSLCQYHDHHHRSKCLWSQVGRTGLLHLPSKGYRLYKNVHLWGSVGSLPSSITLTIIMWPQMTSNGFGCSPFQGGGE